MSLRVYKAPENVPFNKTDITCFLAGGISQCRDWQDEVIEALKKYEFNDADLVILNPRRKSFDLTDINAARTQIEWEFEQLNYANIFSMYFVNSKSDQPICMYELGRNIARIVHLHSNYDDRIVIGCEDGYSRANDVIWQTSLATHDFVQVCMNTTPMIHAEAIYQKYKALVKERAKENA